jgi:PilZ domain
MLEKTFSFWRRLMGHESAAHDSQHDRRLWVRYAADLRGSVQPMDRPDDKILAHVSDLSLGGANLDVERPVTLGQMVTLELTGPSDEVHTLLACVVRVTTRGENKWSLGCVFSRELTIDELESFGAQKTAAADHDKRTWIRYDCAVQACYRKVGDTAGPAQPARVLNISANGIGLSVNPALSAGALLNVDLIDRHGRMVRTMLACVVHTTARAGGDYAVGCNFIRELREDELQSLL